MKSHLVLWLVFVCGMASAAKVAEVPFKQVVAGARARNVASCAAAWRTDDMQPVVCVGPALGKMFAKQLTT
ncbi:MAG: hypothetical protein EOO78_23445 [Oxalobacteraceae bacterium]|nr:MAG: hypothetical protein EOO78_23445 [Oxalobacteraceae bacterium]